MTQCIVVQIETPKKFLLDGIWIGSENAETVFVYVHGLGSNLFSHYGLLEKIVDKKTAVLAFNNQGYGSISKVKQLNAKSVKGYDSHWVGMAHEIFTDCVDDIEGAVGLVKTRGAKQIFLLGHSTGCQKSIYYLSKAKTKNVSGAILLAPMSDFADTLNPERKKVYAKAVLVALKMVASGKRHELLPSTVWPYPIDAQRFLSLYTKESVEEIFGYSSGKKPTVIQKTDVPILVILAQEDEYRDRPIEEIGYWFENIKYKNSGEVNIISGATHGFGKCESEVVDLIKLWLKNI